MFGQIPDFVSNKILSCFKWKLLCQKNQICLQMLQLLAHVKVAMIFFNFALKSKFNSAYFLISIKFIPE